MTRTPTTQTPSTRPGSTTIGLTVLILALAGGTAAVAQDDLDDWEWEPGEGYHEQEWYDPSDWFDADDGVDYEYDWGGYDYGYDDEYTAYEHYDGDAYYDEGYDEWYENENYDLYAHYGDEADGWYEEGYTYSPRVESNADYYDAYYAGYRNGYYDDEFGYDTDAAYEPGLYSAAYADGYYDGYYDQMAGYHYDPYYYVVTHSETASDRRSDRERAGDERQRGDRARQTSEDRRRDAQRRPESQRERDVRHERDEQNGQPVTVQGRLDDVREIDIGSQKFTVVRFLLEDGRSRLIAVDDHTIRGLQDLGAQLSDRVRISGPTKSVQGRRVLVANRVSVDGEKLVSNRSER